MQPLWGEQAGVKMRGKLGFQSLSLLPCPGCPRCCFTTPWTTPFQTPEVTEGQRRLPTILRGRQQSSDGRLQLACCLGLGIAGMCPR